MSTSPWRLVLLVGCASILLACGGTLPSNETTLERGLPLILTTSLVLILFLASPVS
jgi:hypothetical protein